jgi:glutamine amidotransferase
MIAVLNYGLGNIQAFVNIYSRLGVPVSVAESPEQLLHARKIILPGVGAFDWAMDRLNRSGLRAALDDAVLGRKVPVLGICVGMQMMAKGSEEGVAEGLGWIPGHVRRFEESRLVGATRLPHMGWNDVLPTHAHPLWARLDRPRFYFLHSYYFAQADDADIFGTTDYGGAFASVVGRGNILGVQFHPEKSHNWGVNLLHNFAAI